MKQIPIQLPRSKPKFPFTLNINWQLLLFNISGINAILFLRLEDSELSLFSLRVGTSELCGSTWKSPYG